MTSYARRWRSINHVFLCLCAAAAFLAASPMLAEDSPAPLLLPAYEQEEEACYLERRDEQFAALLEYEDVLSVLLSSNLQNGTDQEQVLHLARIEYLVEKIAELALSTGSRKDVQQYLTALPQDKIPPTVRGRILWLQAQLAFAAPAMSLNTVREYTNKLGLVLDWSVLGPLANERGSGFAVAHAPETTPDLAQMIKGKNGSTTWRFHRTLDPLGRIRLDGIFRPNTETMAYALCMLKSDSQQNVILRFGSDDSIAIWMNTQPVFSHRARRTFHFDQNTCRVALQKGWNLLLVKVDQDRGEWQFVLRITDESGAALPSVTAAASSAEQTKAFAAWARSNAAKVPQPEEREVENGAIGQLAKYLKVNAQDARACYYLASLLHSRQHLVGDGAYARQLLMRATRLEPDNLRYYMALASVLHGPERQLPDRDENLRRIILERMRTLEPQTTWALSELADYYLTFLGNQERASSFLREALHINPQSARAHLLHIRLSMEKGWIPLALHELDRLVQRIPNNPQVRLLQGELCLRERTAKDSLDAFQAVLKQNGSNHTALQGALHAAIRLGEPETASHILEQYLLRYPYDIEAHRERAALLLKTQHSLSPDASPKEREAALQRTIEHINNALSHCANNPDLLVLKGRALRAAGKQKEALQAWEQALVLDPGRTELQSYLKMLSPENDIAEESAFDLTGFARQHGEYQKDSGYSHVYLLDELSTRVERDGTHRQRAHQIIRIDTDHGKEALSRIPIAYNVGDERLIIHTARVLHAEGNLQQAEILLPRPFRPGGSVYAQWITFPALSVGDIIEVRYTQQTTRKGFFGDYFGQAYFFRRSMPVRQARYTLITPRQKTFYFHTRNGAPKAVESDNTQDGTRTRSWVMHNLEPLAEEPLMPPRSELSPVVEVSTFADWDALARWYWHLIEEQNRSSPEIRELVATLTRGKTTDKEKLSALYDWILKNIRNEAWEFGVFGYKPYQAATIFSRRFGDCKDKATLLNVMAREIDMHAWPVLLEAIDPAGRKPMRGSEDFTLPILNHFNHCISYVQTGEDSLWLDGTVSYRTLDSLPVNITGARTVIITPDGAQQGTIPTAGENGNRWVENTQLSLIDHNTAEMTQDILGSGHAAVYLRAYFSGLHIDDPQQRQFVRERILQTVATRKYGKSLVREFSLDNTELPDTLRCAFTLRAQEIVQQADGAWHLPPPKALLQGNLLDGSPVPESLSDLAKSSRREYDIILAFPLSIERNLSISWPRGRSLRLAPSSFSIKEPFGECSLDVQRLGTTLSMRFVLDLRTTRIPQASYAAFRRMCILADRFQQTPIILETE